MIVTHPTTKGKLLRSPHPPVMVWMSEPHTLWMGVFRYRKVKVRQVEYLPAIRDCYINVLFTPLLGFYFDELKIVLNQGPNVRSSR